jgi:hypothetical protein
MALSRPGAVSVRLALAVLLASMLVLGWALPAAAAPAATSSYYVRATDPAVRHRPRWSADGSLLTLQAEGGASFTFDAAARRFR